jgi:hypothetical protein
MERKGTKQLVLHFPSLAIITRSIKWLFISLFIKSLSFLLLKRPCRIIFLLISPFSRLLLPVFPNAHPSPGSRDGSGIQGPARLQASSLGEAGACLPQGRQQMQGLFSPPTTAGIIPPDSSDPRPTYDPPPAQQSCCAPGSCAASAHCGTSRDGARTRRLAAPSVCMG